MYIHDANFPLHRRTLRLAQSSQEFSHGGGGRKGEEGASCATHIFWGLRRKICRIILGYIVVAVSPCNFALLRTTLSLTRGLNNFNAVTIDVKTILPALHVGEARIMRSRTISTI